MCSGTRWEAGRWRSPIPTVPPIFGPTTAQAGTGGWSDDYSEDRYIPGDTLVELLSDGAQPEKSSGNSPFIGVLLLAIGGFNAISPQTSWYLSYGWRFKNAEPSDAALLLGRCGGVLAAVIGLFLLFL